MMNLGYQGSLLHLKFETVVSKTCLIPIYDIAWKLNKVFDSEPIYKRDGIGWVEIMWNWEGRVIRCIYCDKSNVIKMSISEIDYDKNGMCVDMWDIHLGNPVTDRINNFKCFGIKTDGGVYRK